jgi:hypothetical protein
MVLVGERRAEEGHDAIAHRLADRSLVVMNGFHHELEDRIEELARLLGVEGSDQLHRGLEVGEQNGDLFALALERVPGSQDLLGEVLWCIAFWRSEGRLCADGHPR